MVQEDCFIYGVQFGEATLVVSSAICFDVCVLTGECFGGKFLLGKKSGKLDLIALCEGKLFLPFAGNFSRAISSSSGEFGNAILNLASLLLK